MKRLYLVAAIVLAGCTKNNQAPPPPPVPKVTVAPVQSQTVPYVVKGVGHVTPYYTADIKAQVEGYLLSYSFNEGSIVHKDDLLYTIDPSPYQASLAKAIAVRNEDLASYEYAVQKVKSYEPLLPEQYVSKLNMLEYEKNANVFLASIERDEAEIILSKINLDYCYIKAPFTGRVGKRLIDPGNLITNNGDTMVTLTQVSPIYIDFSIPERDLPKIIQYQTEKGLTSKIHLPQSNHPDITAQLVLIDNFIDQNTGMIPLRAQTENTDHFLWPGQFVDVDVVLFEKENALLVPSIALLLGQKGSYLYVVKNGVVEARDVEVGPSIGELVVIEKGVSADESIVTSGMFRLKPGMKVQIVNSQV